MHSLSPNYRLTNVQAGMLYDQLNDIDNILSLKRQVFKRYDALVSVYPHLLSTFTQEEGCERSCWMYPVYSEKPFDFEVLYEKMQAMGVDIRPFFYPIRRHPHLDDLGIDDSLAENLPNHIIILPSYPTISPAEQGYIVEALIGVLTLL